MSEPGNLISEALREIAGQAAAPRQAADAAWRAGRRRLRAAIAAPAAAATVFIAVLSAVVLPQAPGHDYYRTLLEPGSAAQPKFMITVSRDPATLWVRSAATGAVVAQIKLPGRRDVGAVATGNGRLYVVAVYQPYPCRSWLYQFRLNDHGQPTALAPFPAMPTMAGAALDSMAVSGNGQMLAYATASYGPDCVARKPGPPLVGVTDLATGQTRQWAIPGTSSVSNLSLTASGSQLLYGLGQDPSVVRIIPTSAPPGNAADRGQTVIRATRSAAKSQWTFFSAISPDGKPIYFNANPPGEAHVTDWSPDAPG